MKRELLKDQLLLDESIKENHGSRPTMKGVLYERGKDDFGQDIFRKVGENTVVVGGAILALQKLCGVEASWQPKTLNELYDVPTANAGTTAGSTIALFGVGTGGSGLQFGSLVEKDIKRRDVPNLIPLRVTDTLTGDDSDLYYFKKDNGDGTYNWYLKEFSMVPTISTHWKDSLDEETDGSEITDEIADSKRTEGLQTFAEFILDFNTSDVREYYQAIGSLDQALYNSIGLFTGQKVQQADGSYEYANVRLFSYLNIDNKSVRLKTASQYVYRILSLV